jgi:hypothetical protein
MLKKVCAGLMGIMLMVSTGFAAPPIDLKQGQSTIGYYHLSLTDHVDLGQTVNLDAKDNGMYFQTAVSDKLLVGVEFLSGRASKMVDGANLRLSAKPTDITLEYKINNGVHLILGNRNYDNTMSLNGIQLGHYDVNKLIYGLTGSTKLNDTWSGYFVYKRNDVASDFNIGVYNELSKDMYLDLYYVSDKLKDLSNGVPNIHSTGFGVGVGYKF